MHIHCTQFGTRTNIMSAWMVLPRAPLVVKVFPRNLCCILRSASIIFLPCVPVHMLNKARCSLCITCTSDNNFKTSKATINISLVF